MRYLHPAFISLDDQGGDLRLELVRKSTSAEFIRLNTAEEKS
jgi:hypothetical protein